MLCSQVAKPMLARRLPRPLCPTCRQCCFGLQSKNTKPKTQHVTPQFHLHFDDSFSSVRGTAAQQELTIDTILQCTAWLYQDDFAAPSDHYHFQPLPSTPTAQLASVPASADHLHTPIPRSNHTGKPRYRPVPSSAAFTAWKAAQGICSDVFMAVPHSTPTSGSAQGTLNGASTPSTTPNMNLEGANLGMTATGATSTGIPPTHTSCPVPYAVSTSQDPTSPLVFSATAAPSPGDTLTQSAMLKAPDRPDFYPHVPAS